MEFFKKRKKVFVIILSALVVAAGMYTCGRKHGGAMWTEASVGTISAGQAILIDADTGKVLYEKAADQRAYPASTTKIMTALLTLETPETYDSPIEQKVEIPAEAAGVEGSSLYLEAGEKISIEDLLYGMMLVSGKRFGGGPFLHYRWNAGTLYRNDESAGERTGMLRHPFCQSQRALR